MNFTEVRNGIVDNLLKEVDNVEQVFVHPEARAEQEGEFPYVVLVFGEGVVNGRKVEQDVSIIGFVKGEDDTIPDQIDVLKDKVYNALYNKEPKVLINSQNINNLFAPFGLDAGVFPPFGGFRFECVVPVHIVRK